jgi:hypothetical protein
MKKAAEILARLLEKGPAGAPPFHALFGGWQEIAGPSLAEHCRAYEVRHHSLLVEADHPGWMQLLLMQKKAILARIHQRFPQLELRDIRVRVGGAKPAMAAPKPAIAARQPAAAASAAPHSSTSRPEGSGPAAGQTAAAPSSAEVEQALAAVGDPELREKLRLLLQELERRIDTAEDK